MGKDVAIGSPCTINVVRLSYGGGCPGISPKEEVTK